MVVKLGKILQIGVKNYTIRGNILHRSVVKLHNIVTFDTDL